MTGRGFRHGVILHAVREERCVAADARQAAGQLRPEALEIVAAELVDHDQDDEGRSWGGAGNGNAGSEQEREQGIEHDDLR